MTHLPTARGGDQFMIRFPDGMRQQLKSMAALNRRSLNAEVIILIERALRGEQAAGTDPEKASPAADHNDARQSVAVSTHA